ncbi:zf-HC2 domain-containing protein, partial [Bacteroides fragilis]|nr:zf-HC2 domain-containing protein [Bacteroides fragilis]
MESCEQCRAYRDKAAALSRSLSFVDGEPTDVSSDIIETHVESCEQCRAYRDKAAALSRSLSFV